MDLLWLSQPRSHGIGLSRLCLGLLVVLVASGLLLNTLLDVDCLQLQPAACCCQTYPGAQSSDIQADTCSHCMGWLPVLVSVALPAASFAGLPIHKPAARIGNILQFERPPIFA